ncbi:hypothetical protein GCM10010145_50060 [Streptomyces ruber]|uniref:Uncharacterized protein n=2 Tax=Streptomyces TaxID=1883 RepID=A0A918EUP3_9ACTN|nr:hypothetical protein GCM10010145_50060 [Streptomyces ruber]
MTVSRSTAPGVVTGVVTGAGRGIATAPSACATGNPADARPVTAVSEAAAPRRSRRQTAGTTEEVATGDRSGTGDGGGTGDGDDVGDRGEAFNMT